MLTSSTLSPFATSPTMTSPTMTPPPMTSPPMTSPPMTSPTIVLFPTLTPHSTPLLPAVEANGSVGGTD
ncbi:unnamed protein product [Gemmataceae bacterium]|nr:unnamed protein product [Gemmataceae bacterium]VTU00918.1 unnamed protein product [Gemmataceae bacterium]